MTYHVFGAISGSEMINLYCSYCVSGVLIFVCTNDGIPEFTIKHIIKNSDDMMKKIEKYAQHLRSPFFNVRISNLRLNEAPYFDSCIAKTRRVAFFM